ncbi:hypothetical protein [Pseudonocardia sp. H11422]|uniref:hypothetical protein n=1 Tax=Pseudonocardia sp. H11422 TaxID=2835866 RepID=UPI0020284A7F|nr:hypothetical protein [Pseudonocardia sp. H11422]
MPLDPGGDPAEEELLRLAAAAVGNEDDRTHETGRAVVETAPPTGCSPRIDPTRLCPPQDGFSAAVRAGRLVVEDAPGVVLGRCVEAGTARQKVQQLARDGLRVLAVADRALDDEPEDLEDAARTSSPCTA